MDKYFKIAQILARSFFGTLTAEEKQLLEQWRSQSAKNESLYLELLDPESAKAAFELINRFKKRQGQKHMSWQHKKTVHLSVYLVRASAAAAIFLLAILTGVMLHRNNRNVIVDDSTRSEISVLPGKPGALLTLASGEMMVLDGQMIDSVVLTDDSRVAFVSDKQISYLYQKGTDIQDNLPGEAELVYNTLEVPMKAEYRIILDDGTRVALNAGSSLRYPVRFGRKNRQVEVRGEAFFDIAHDETRPFEVVDCFGNRIEDIGTSFNVKAYADDKEHMVVLVEGEIVFHPNNGEDKNLSPGYGILYHSTASEPIVTPVDVDELTAWKEGRFIFNNKPLTYIFSNISRWYGVELDPVDEKVGLLHFTVDIPKYENLATIISVLESTGSIKFIKDGDKLKVYSN